MTVKQKFNTKEEEKMFDIFDILSDFRGNFS